MTDDLGYVVTIYLYSGTPGTGKSLHAANDVRFALNHDRPVIGNFEISHDAYVKHPEQYHYYPNWELRPELLYEFSRNYWASGHHRYREDWITLVIDECQLLFNSREWSAKDRLQWLEFFSQHRKYGYKVLFVAQSAKMVDNQFRMLIEYDVNHRKMSNAGFWGWLLSLPFGGRLFLQVAYYFQQGERLYAHWYVAKRADMRLYDTNSTFERVSADLLPVVPDPSM